MDLRRGRLPEETLGRPSRLHPHVGRAGRCVWYVSVCVCAYDAFYTYQDVLVMFILVCFTLPYIMSLGMNNSALLPFVLPPQTGSRPRVGSASMTGTRRTTGSGATVEP